MKLIAKMTLIISLFTTLAFAVDGLTLKQNMKGAGTQLKSIAANLKDQSKIQANTDAASKLIDFLAAARNQAPEGSNLEEFQALMDQAITEAQNLQKALITNDLVAAEAALSKLTIVKKEGHDKFDQ